MRSSTSSKKRLPLAVVARNFPAWETVSCWFGRRWRIDGTWERLDAALRERVRIRLGRNLQPSAAR